jgi:hypothetical protein
VLEQAGYLVETAATAGEALEQYDRIAPLGRFNTEDEIETTIKCVVEQVNRLRELSVLYEMAQKGKDLP